MTVLTFRTIESFPVCDGNEYTATEVVETTRDEMPVMLFDVWHRYTVRRDGGGIYFCDDHIDEYWTEEDAKDAAAKLALEARSAIPGAFCFWPGGDEWEVYLDPRPEWSRNRAHEAACTGTDGLF